jgi:hypothetical protein
MFNVVSVIITVIWLDEYHCYTAGDTAEHRVGMCGSLVIYFPGRQEQSHHPCQAVCVTVSSEQPRNPGPNAVVQV